MDRSLTEPQAHALDVAAELVRCGVPVFAAPADTGTPSGFALPRGWDRTDITQAWRAIEAWRPGWALCAVMGHALDLVDFDPHNGTPGEEFTAWPHAYGVAATPSGGQHMFVAALRVGSRDGILPGVDVKGGRPDGSGRGFAFIAPTVRVSKVDGSQRAYQWIRGPDAHEVSQMAHVDASGAALAELVRSKLSASTNRVNGSAPTYIGTYPAVASWNAPSRELVTVARPTRGFTFEEAWRYCEPWLRALAAAPDGRRNAALNDAAKVLSHFGPEFWPVEWAYETLVATVPAKDPGTGVRVWDPRSTITSAFRSAEGDWRAERDWHREGARFPSELVGNSRAIPQNGHSGHELVVRSRWVDLGPYLDGSYVPPSPSAGAWREDGAQLLYPGAWHTLVGSTGAGKTWLALAHARDELLRPDGAGHVVYAHFEESSPPRTLDRLLSLGVPADVIRERLHWYDTNESNMPGEFAAWLAALGIAPRLVVLDGINSACTTHGQDPQAVAAVGWYRGMFVTPATQAGAAVLSLGHPTKAKDRQAERHGFGSTAWLDEADGVGFRLESKQGSPIRRGVTGVAYLSSVKDRYGQVELLGRPGNRDGWHYLGSIVVDNESDPAGRRTTLRLVGPKPGEQERTEASHPVTVLAGEIERVLSARENRAYDTQAHLEDWLHENGVRFHKAHIDPALGELSGQGRLERDPAGGVGRRRGGRLIGQNPESTLESDSTVL